MAKQKRTARQERRAAQRAKRKDKAAERRGRAADRREEQKRPYTLADCMKLGRTANILFIVFIVICLIYYYSLARRGNYQIAFETVAYTVEAIAFAMFTIGVIWLDRLVRSRRVMKVLLIVYIAVEVVLMLLEFQFLPWTYYNGQNMALIIAHVLFSAGVSFSLLLLDPQNKRHQTIVTITTALILVGMFFPLAHYRIYASILLNAVSYIFFFTAMLNEIRLEEVRVDCYGDKAESASFQSTMFADTPTMVERPAREKPASLLEAAKRAAEVLQSDEREVLTDPDEEFEYEFGVQEDDDDEDYDDDYDGEEYDEDDYDEEDGGDGTA